MKQGKVILLGAALALAGAASAVAQAQSTMAPPKVLVVTREFVKPGKTGAPHQKTESAFVQAMARAKWPTHYFAMTSLSGDSRALFLTGYDSFDAWDRDNHAAMNDKTFAAELDRAAVADGELLSSMDQSELVFNPDLSLNAAVDIAHMRLMEVDVVQVKPGHHGQVEELCKMYIRGYQNIPDAHWATYESAYGGADRVVFFIPMKSGAEIDAGFAQGKNFEAALGKDGMKKLHELEADSIESSMGNLFSFEPAMSYPPEEWVKADPGFWKVKPAMAAPMAKKPEAKAPATP
jgi:hypothetical protein